MQARYSRRNAYRESLEISSDQPSGLIVLTLKLGRIPEDAVEDMLALLTSWWLRWIGTLDCAFFQVEDTWRLYCQIDENNRAALSHVLRDMLAIKNTGFL